MTDRKEIERALAQHARQHEAVARLGQIALREHQLRTLIDEVAATVADTLDLQLCGVSRLREDERMLDIIVSLGVPHPVSVLRAGTGTQAGYALSTNQTVVSEDLSTETRFDTSTLLGKGMLSGMSAVIEGEERSFGVLSAHSARKRSFSADDVNFLVAVANVLSAAVERHGKEEAARHAALHDPLTGLPNRTLALDRLDLALARHTRDGTTVAMLLLDVDRFKIINDSLGHEAGDEVLVALASRVRETLRTSDTVARMSGDEFVVVCESDGGVHRVVELAERIGATVGRPLVLSSGEHILSASIGIAVAEGPNDTSAALLRDADAALHRAKQRGPGSYELFDATMRAQVLSRLRTETELRNALDHRQLCVHYQPIIDLANGRPVAMEALVRWEHPDHGLIAPPDFIPIAEETGLIAELGREVLDQACAQGATWQRRFDLPLQMFVNVSGRQVTNPAFPDEVTDILTRSGLSAGTLGLEVTESVLIDEQGPSMTVLNKLHEHGVQLVLDDFGTGYSSLSYLRNFPLSGVKVDRSFTNGLGTNPDDAAIIRAIVQMCRALELRVVVEGVESQSQLRQLGQLACEYVQGYLLCRPMPAEGIGDFLERNLSARAGEPVTNGSPSAANRRPQRGTGAMRV